MGQWGKHWTAALTTAAAAGLSLVAWKMYMRRGRHGKILYSLRSVATRGSLPLKSDHSVTAIYMGPDTQPEVYSIGGHGSNSETLDVYILDRDRDEWKAVPTSCLNDRARVAISAERCSHASADVGRTIYVMGGFTNRTEGDILKFNTEIHQWSIPSFSGDAPGPRSSHSATVVGNKIYVFGGYGEGSPLNDVHILDTDTGTWIAVTVLGSPPSGRCAHAALLLNDDRILIYGGYSNQAEGDIWFLEVDTPYVKAQRTLLGREVVAWSKGAVGTSPRPIVICGPSGVGKGTLIAKLMREFPDEFGFSVSHTTRKPRNKEVDGVHYHFTERNVMELEVQAGKFLESADVHGNLYGTSLMAVEAVADAGKRCILDIDVQGAQLVKRSNLDALYIFVTPPSIQELETRLRGRATETEEQIQKRLKNSEAEIERGRDPALFDFVLINDSFEATYEQLKRVLGLSFSTKSHVKATSAVMVHPEPRSGHSLSSWKLKACLYGGLTVEGTSASDLYVLDISKRVGGSPGTTRGLQWIKVGPRFSYSNYFIGSSVVPPRYNHGAVSLNASEVLVCGGYNDKHALSDAFKLTLQE